MKQAEDKEDVNEEVLQNETQENTVEEQMEEPSASEEPETSADTQSKEDTSSAEPNPEEEAAILQLLRLRADFDNFRKRTRKEKEEWTQRCLENLCTDLLTVLDHFDLGIENSRNQEVNPEMLKGFELVRGQLATTLGSYGLSPVVVEEKDAFDPNEHEAITHMASETVPEGAVVAMTRKGYRLGNKLLRPTQVVVSSGNGEDTSGGTD